MIAVPTPEKTEREPRPLPDLVDGPPEALIAWWWITLTKSERRALLEMMEEG